MNESDTGIPDGEKLLEEMTQSYEEKWRRVHAKVEEFSQALLKLQRDYEGIDSERALANCSLESFELISYQQELLHLGGMITDIQSKLIQILQERFNDFCELSDAEQLLLNAASNLEIKMAAYLAKEEQKIQSASAGGRARVANAPKQKEKHFVRECWDEWQKHPDRYRSKSAFASDMLSKCEHLSSQKKIEDWCREWEKHPAPS